MLLLLLMLMLMVMVMAMVIVMVMVMVTINAIPYLVFHQDELLLIKDVYQSWITIFINHDQLSFNSHDC